MEDSSAVGSSPAPDAPRRSGRVTKKPHLLSEQLGVHAKRKRVASSANEEGGDEQGDVDMLDEDEDESSEEEDDSQDEDVMPERKRARKATAPKPRTKSSNQNANGVDLAIRPAKSSRPPKSRAKKTARFASAAAARGLYSEVFGKGRPLDDVATEWVGRHRENESASMAELFTFALRCAGCDEEIDETVVADPDSFKDRISEIQEKFQAENATEYPLIAKSRSTVSFKQMLDAFVQSLVLTIEKADLLFSGFDIIESYSSWVSSMSSSGNRALRHTATAIAMSILSALCEVGRELAEKKSKLQRQMEGERKKNKGVNKGRVAELNAAKTEIDEQEQALRDRLSDIFDTVFVHRYRDVDPHIRLDGIHALSECIMIYPDVFFEGTYLRYLGWLLSDPKPDIRHEVLKGLLKLYSDQTKLSGLESFTEKFRPRVVEMAAQDSDTNVRVPAIQLLDLFREAAFLEPDDIDAIGRLIFDSDLRVRKAVVNFFVAIVNDAYDAMLGDLGGTEAVEEIFGDEEPDEADYDSPRLQWLKFRALVDQLQSYDAQLEVEPTEMIHVPHTSTYMLVPGLQSRFSLAAEVICEQIPDMRWELLAGYLLYDHSRAMQNGNTNGVDGMSRFKEAVALSAEAEVLLLEVLNSAVRLSLTSSNTSLQDKTKRTTKAQKVAEQDALESGERHLTTLIPRLLNKFDAVPEAASAILRLEHVLNPENQNYNDYGTLLEVIKKQFLAHAKPSVLEEASLALLHARSATEADELAHEKLSSLVEDVIEKLNKLAKTTNLTIRGSLTDDHLEILEGCAIRLEMLGRVVDFSSLLETAPAESRKKSAGSLPIDILIGLLGRGQHVDHLDSETHAQEDNVVRYTARSLGIYFMWKVSILQTQLKTSGSVAPSTVKAIAGRKQKVIEGITKVLEQKHSSDDVRAVLAGSLVDISVAFTSLLNIAATKKNNQSAEGSDTSSKAYLDLATEIPAKTQTALLHVFSLAEKAYAKRLKRSLEDVEDDEPATDDEPEDDEEEKENGDAEVQLRANLIAERRLCEIAGKLVLGIWAGALDGKKEGQNGAVRKRLRRNKTRLGPQFKGVIDMMERGGPAAATKVKRAAAKMATAPTAAATSAKSQEIVIDSDEEEESEQEDADADAGNEREEVVEEAVDQAPSEPENDEVPDEEPESVLGD